MNIKVILPNQTWKEAPVSCITAPGKEGIFQILPKHIDATWNLRVGILTLTHEGHTSYLGIHEGFLVKRGQDVFVVCLQAVEGDSLSSLEINIRNMFAELGEMERKAREVLIKMEMETMKRFLDLDG